MNFALALLLKAVVKVNMELILVYWQLGKEIVGKQQEANEDSYQYKNSF